MKKFLIILAAFLVVGSTAYAQPRFGIRGGLSLASSSFNSKEDLKASSVNGFNAGILFETSLFPFVSLQPEVLFDQRGSKLDLGGGVESTLRTNYATIPLFFKVSVPITSSFKANLHAGPYAGIALGGTAEVSVNGTKDSRNVLVVNSYDKEEASKPQVSLVDYGAIAGVGLSYDVIANLAVFLDVRYALGFAEVQKYAETSGPSTPSLDALKEYQKSANRAVQISAGVSFKIGE